MKENGSSYVRLPARKHILVYFYKLYRLLKRYHIVHVNGNSATIAIELMAAKLAIVNVRIAHIHNSKTNHRIIHQCLLPIFLKSYTRGLACSELAGNWLFGKGNFEVLRNAIDLKKFKYSPLSREKIRKELGISKKTIVLGHVGRINEQKNQLRLLQIFSLFQAECYKDSKLLLVGDGSMRLRLQKEISALNLDDKVVMTGERTDIPDLLCAMDVFVFPSQWEGLGLVVIESQAAGMPCVVSENLPHDVYLTDSVKVVSLTDSDKTWVDKIKNVCDVDREKSSLINKMLITRGGYNIEIEAIKMEQIYRL